MRPCSYVNNARNVKGKARGGKAKAKANNFGLKARTDITGFQRPKLPKSRNKMEISGQIKK
jgi:hypothetical protein